MASHARVVDGVANSQSPLHAQVFKSQAPRSYERSQNWLPLPTAWRGQGAGAGSLSGSGFGFPISSPTCINSMIFIKSTPPQNRQRIVLVSNSKKLVDDFVGKLTF